MSEATEDTMQYLAAHLSSDDYARLSRLNNKHVAQLIYDVMCLCRPARVFIVDDSAEHVSKIRDMAIKNGEEYVLTCPGHTVHFDGYFDQGRDKNNTRYLVPAEDYLDKAINQMERTEGLREARTLLRDSMIGKDMIVRFFALGPLGSEFMIPAVQITDSYYVAHSLDLLYRRAYDQFAQSPERTDFFRVIHSTGRLENGVSADVNARRIFIDYIASTVYSINTQYAGNTVGLKKLAFRLAIRRADHEGWLAEHMFIMGVHGPHGRKTYFTGAYPSGCGKTSTSMIHGATIVGDDLAYLQRVGKEIRAVNVERGMFGIIRGVNARDDPLIFEALTTPGETIFSNVLVHEGVPYWLEDGRTQPNSGRNHVGEWHRDMVGPDGAKVPISSRNARFTFALERLKNLDEALEDPRGVSIGGVIYGGRDSDTLVPVREAFDWTHGVISIGASLESESTAATLGTEGVRQPDPFANMDFISIPLGRYISNHLRIVTGISRPPRIFGVNYFIRGENGEYLNSREDKQIWLKWMEQRVHNDISAIRTPIGLIPDYEDLHRLFGVVLNKEYTRDAYKQQFTIRIPELLKRIERVRSFYENNVKDAPPQLFEVLDNEYTELNRVRTIHGDYPGPDVFKESR